MQIERFKNGLTVAELKQLIADWPETDEHGEPCEVWLGNTQYLTNPVKERTIL